MSTTKPLIITAGEKYNDIDILACAVSYKKLLELKGISSQIVFPGPLNESVTKTIREWKFTFETALAGGSKGYDYIIVDVSEPQHFAKFVVPDNVIEVYDHHHGFEDYWKEKLGDKARIESVGACATLIWEEFKKAGLENNIDAVSANLLYTAILSNTLNMQAQVTSSRDSRAIEELVRYTSLPKDWRQIYFDEVSLGIMSDPLEFMASATKILDSRDEKYVITQLELWDSQKFINDNHDLILEFLSDRKVANTFLTSPSISQGFNYLVATNPSLKDKLKSTLGASWDGDVGKTKKLWLRKEIMPLL
jgi:hypothetical protein